MRVLFSFVGGIGHLEPLIPVARAAVAKGHVVAFACSPGVSAEVEAAGFAARPMGESAPTPRGRTDLQPLDRAREERDLRERFVRRSGAYRAPRLMALCEDWRPDVLVFDETDFGALVAAERRGLPFATFIVIAAGGFVRPDVVVEALDELRVAHGLDPDPRLEAPGRHLVLAPVPPRYRDPAFPLPATAHHFRGESRAAGEIARPTWPVTRPDAPTVYFTLGTVFNLESGDLFSRVVAGLRELPVNAVVTVGREIDPREFGPQPGHVHVASYIPQAALLPHCDLVVSHAGSGSVLGALAHGLPSVLIPIGADQPLNAARCKALGVARVLSATDSSSDDVRAAAAAVLQDPAMRRRAREFEQEIEALPGPDHAVRLLEQLTS